MTDAQPAIDWDPIDPLDRRPFSFQRWIDEHRDQLRPPVANKQVFRQADMIIMVVGGGNERNDFHDDPREEFFHQLKGDMILWIWPGDGVEPYPMPIREGEIYLLPARVPHSPMRPKDTIGLVIEQKRPEGSLDRLRWYCESCHEQVHEASFTLQNIATDLKRIMEEFWTDDALRTCGACGAKVEQPGEAQPPAPAA